MNNKNTFTADASNIAFNLYKCLQNTHKTIEDIAFELGVAPRTIYYWTSGERIPKLETLIELAYYFSVTVDDLLK